MFFECARRLWLDETGVVATSDLILISTIVVIGVIVGLVTLRDQVVQELGDLAGAIGELNQSYSFAGVTFTGATIAGSEFVDNEDDCEGDGTGTEGQFNNDTAGQAPLCISLAVNPEAEP